MELNMNKVINDSNNYNNLKIDELIKIFISDPKFHQIKLLLFQYLKPLYLLDSNDLFKTSIENNKLDFNDLHFYKIYKILLDLGSDCLNESSINSKTGHYFNTIYQIPIIDLIFNKFKYVDESTLEDCIACIFNLYILKIKHKKYLLSLDNNQLNLNLELNILKKIKSKSVIFVIEDETIKDWLKFEKAINFISKVEISLIKFTKEDILNLFSLLNIKLDKLIINKLTLNNFDLDDKNNNIILDYFSKDKNRNSLVKLEVKTTRNERLNNLINHESIKNLILLNEFSLKQFPKNIYQHLLSDYYNYSQLIKSKETTLKFKNIEVFVNDLKSSNSDLNKDYNFELNNNVLYIDNKHLIEDYFKEKSKVTEILNLVLSLSRVESLKNKINDNFYETKHILNLEIEMINLCGNLLKLNFSFTNYESAIKVISEMKKDIKVNIKELVLYLYDLKIEEEKEDKVIKLITNDFLNLVKFDYRCSYFPQINKKFYNFEFNEIIKLNSSNKDLPLKLISLILQNNNKNSNLYFLSIRHNNLILFTKLIIYLKKKNFDIFKKIRNVSHEDTRIYKRAELESIYKSISYEEMNNLKHEKLNINSLLDFRTNDSDFTLFLTYFNKIKQFEILKNPVSEEFIHLSLKCNLKIIIIDKDPFGIFLKYLLHNYFYYHHLLWLNCRGALYKTEELKQNKIENIKKLQNLVYLKLHIDNNFMKLQNIFNEEEDNLIKLKKDSTYNFGILYII